MDRTARYEIQHLSFRHRLEYTVGNYCLVKQIRNDIRREH